MQTRVAAGVKVPAPEPGHIGALVLPLERVTLFHISVAQFPFL